MYVITFYSFKGGVGRTMGMVNVATHLARTGRRVLMVDFDLEAPGLDTLEFAGVAPNSPGVVDYVSEYLVTGESPEISQYIYEIGGVGRDGGHLYLMPAGMSDDGYADRLSRIDWAELYEEKDGYLFFENLKAQWDQFLAPDYVLIDSRTGHTDVGGICTRHLPDAVVAFFLPNRQNLRGLRKVIADIRSEANPPRGKSIELHFVMSNIPDLDDEENILAARLQEFRAALEVKSSVQLDVIHRYDSLALLNQSVFVDARPNSRLAREYRELATKLTNLNPGDRSAALQQLKDMRRQSGTVSPQIIENRIAAIHALHGNDPIVLGALARARRMQGRIEEAQALFDEAIQKGNLSAELILDRAELLAGKGDVDGVTADTQRVLNQSNVNPFTIGRAIRLLRVAMPNALANAAQFKSIVARSSSDKLWIAQQLRWTHAELSAGTTLLLGCLSDAGLGEEERQAIRSELGFNLVATQQFAQAFDLLEGPAKRDSARINDVFNLAIAKWGIDGRPTADLFLQVTSLQADQAVKFSSANFDQCLALSNWAIGNIDLATKYLGDARAVSIATPQPTVSCWRYRMVQAPVFLDDLLAMGSAFREGVVEPEVMRREALPESTND